MACDAGAGPFDVVLLAHVELAQGQVEPRRPRTDRGRPCPAIPGRQRPGQHQQRLLDGALVPLHLAHGRRRHLGRLALGRPGAAAAPPDPRAPRARTGSRPATAHEPLDLLGVDVPRDDDGAVVGPVVLLDEGLGVLQGGGGQRLVGPPARTATGVPGGIQRLEDQIEHLVADRGLPALPELVAHHLALGGEHLRGDPVDGAREPPGLELHQHLEVVLVGGGVIDGEVRGGDGVEVDRPSA